MAPEVHGTARGVRARKTISWANMKEETTRSGVCSFIAAIDAEVEEGQTALANPLLNQRRPDRALALPGTGPAAFASIRLPNLLSYEPFEARA